MKIRAAKVSDVKSMHSLISFYAERKEMLPRSLNDIYENLQEFVVAEENNKIVGCCAIHISWEDLAEIKALAVAQNSQKKGIGTKLVQALHKKANELGIIKTFALTFKPDFFTKLGYVITTKEKLPHKIWGECVKCHLFPDCGEIPLIKELTLKEKRKK